MSTYYYFVSKKAKENFELCSGSWYCCLEDLDNILRRKVDGKKPYSDFVKCLRKEKALDGLWDMNVITPDFERYFLKPLYDWAFDHPDFELMDEYTMWDIAEKAGKLSSDDYWHTMGHMLYEKKDMARIGVSFERALTELKAGAVIWRKENIDCRWWRNGNKIEWTYGDDCTDPIFDGWDLLAEDWTYETI